MPRSLLDRLRIARSAMQQLTKHLDRTEGSFESSKALAGRQPPIAAPLAAWRKGPA